ncbi:MAG TPA: FCD domain-containing protein [Vicinamibacterales bacterium]|nr:FCD domain-containing protein [Vicinamibacterales bacterium]
MRHLVSHIRKRRLTTGDPIPSEVRLSADLNVSRSIVREAYRSLASAGILDIANGRSPRVGRLSNRTLTQVLQHALSTDQASRNHVFEVRRSIEIRAAELAATRRTEDHLVELLDAAAAMRAAGDRRAHFIRADMRFHEIIGRATGNPLFVMLGDALRACVQMTIDAGFDSRRTRTELARVAEIHAGIAQAIVDRDAAQARKRMKVHFDEARAYVVGPPPRRPRPR